MTPQQRHVRHTEIMETLRRYRAEPEGARWRVRDMETRALAPDVYADEAMARAGERSHTASAIMALFDARPGR